MRATMLLADFCQVSNGKLTLVGAAWTATGKQPVQAAIGLVFHVPYSETDKKHQWRLELIDSDGHPITFSGSPESEDEPPVPVKFEGELETGRPPGMQESEELSVPVALNLPQGHPVFPEEPTHYEWRLWVDDQTSEDWRLPFTINP